jgi:hypothetical protein
MLSGPEKAAASLSAGKIQKMAVAHLNDLQLTSVLYSCGNFFTWRGNTMHVSKHPDLLGVPGHVDMPRTRGCWIQ